MSHAILYSLGLTPLQRAAVDGAAWPFRLAFHFDEDRDLAAAVSGHTDTIVLTGSPGRTLPILDTNDGDTPLIILALDDAARSEVKSAEPIHRRHEIVSSLDDVPQAIDRLIGRLDAARLSPPDIGRLIMERSLDAIFVSNAEGQYVAANPAGLKLLGYPAEELRTKSVRDILEPEELARQAPRFGELAAGNALRTERRLRRKDGSIFDAEISASPLHDGLLLGIVRDITERKRIEAELRLNERQLLEAQALARAASWSWQVGAPVVRLSPGLVQLIELPPGTGETPILQLRTMLIGEDQNRMDAALSRACQEQAPLDEVVRLRLASGRSGVFRIRGIVWEPAGPQTYIGFTQDITEEVQSQDRLLAGANQQRAVAEAGRFALGGGSLEDLWKLAAASVAEHLPSEICTLALFDAAGSLTLRVARGWPDDDVHRVNFTCGERSASGEALKTGAPVIIEDLRSETRFDAPRLRALGVVSGIVVPVAGSINHGVLGAFSMASRAYSPEDITFVSAIGNIVAAAMERAEVLNQLALQHSSLQTLLNALPDRVVRYRSDMTVAYSNVRTEVDDLKHVWPCGEICPHDESCGEIIRDTLRTGLPIRAQLPVTPDGRTLQIRTIPEPDVSGEIAHVLTVCADLTSEIRAREEREALTARLEQAERVAALGRVAAVIAHEFNNVLMAVDTAVEVTSRSNTEMRDAKILALARQSITRGRSITQEILRYTRPGEVVRQPTNVSAWLRSTLAEVRHMLPPQIQVDLQCPEDSLVILADGSQLQQVMINLIINARDAMPEGGTITVRAEREEGIVHVTVKDTGCGISESAKARIFEPLFTTKRNGTGLGLTVVEQIVARHGGSIAVESELGAGTAFHIMLPHEKPGRQQPSGPQHA